MFVVNEERTTRRPDEAVVVSDPEGDTASGQCPQDWKADSDEERTPEEAGYGYGV